MNIIELVELNHQMSAPHQKEDMITRFQDFLYQGEKSQAYLALFSIGVLHFELNRPLDAEAYFRHCLFIKPDFFICVLNLGLLLEKQNKYQEAIDVWSDALQHPSIHDSQNKNDHLTIATNCGRLAESIRDYDKAEQALMTAYQLDPDPGPVLQHLIHLRQKKCSWPVADNITLSEDEIYLAASPMAILGLSDNPQIQLEVARNFVKTKIEQFNRMVPYRFDYNHEKLRIGYLSSNLNMHAVSLLTVELFECHNRDLFEIHAFCWSPEEVTAFRHRVVKSFDVFHPIAHLSDQEAAALIVSNEIDIIIDLQGLTSGARVNLIARGAAPVQISWLGFPGPSAIPHVDYIICDPFIMPDELKDFFIEKPLLLPRLFQVCDTQRIVSAIPDRSHFGFSEKDFIFCAFNNSHKYTPDIFALWMQILRHVPQSILWLLEDNQWSRQNLIQAARSHGISPQRLHFAGRIQPEDYLARFAVADLFLDTTPYNAGTTANDALWAGLPLLTLSGKTYASRMAGSLLNSLGLNDFIAFTEADYVQKSIHFSQNPDALKTVRQALKEAKQSGQLFNTKVFAADYEHALLKLFDRV